MTQIHTLNWTGWILLCILLRPLLFEMQYLGDFWLNCAWMFSVGKGVFCDFRSVGTRDWLGHWGFWQSLLLTMTLVWLCMSKYIWCYIKKPDVCTGNGDVLLLMVIENMREVSEECSASTNWYAQFILKWSSNAKHKKSHENLVCKWVYTTVSSGPQIWLLKWLSNSADIECWSDDLFFVGQPGSYHHPVSLDTNLIGFSQCFWVIAKIQLSDQQTFTIRRSKKLYVGYTINYICGPI